MFITAHILAGLILGKIYGNYLVALIGALFLDLDHLIPYVREKIIFKPKKLWKVLTDPKDPYGDQRNFLHNVIALIIISGIVFLIDSRIGLIFGLAYLSHLVIDGLDGSDFYPLYPLKWNFKGPIKYMSIAELVFTLALLVVFILI